MSSNYRQLLVAKLLELKKEKIQVFRTRPWWLKAAFSILHFFTKVDYDRFTQAIGNRIYVSKYWNTMTDYSKFYLLIHEQTHCRQFKRYTFPVMAFLYLLFPLPIGLAYFRAKFEREARRAVLSKKIELGETIFPVFIKESYIESFCGPAYLWPWPFKNQVMKWASEDSVQLPK